MPVEVGIREWLAALERAGGRGTDGLQVATFDTRITKVRRLPGSAARAAAKQLRRMGYRMLTQPENFYLDETTGPISTTEITRARHWGTQLAHLATSIQPA